MLIIITAIVSQKNYTQYRISEKATPFKVEYPANMKN
jgi:hypothetical protein